MEQNDVDASDGIFLLLVNFSDHNFVRGADTSGILQGFPG